MKQIYILGNPLLDFDNLPIKLLPNLQKAFPEIEFIETDPGDNLIPDKNSKLYIIDTSEEITEVKLLQDLSKIKTEPKYSVHDYDLGMHLLLLQKLGILRAAKIFCVPMKIEEKIALKQLTKLIKKNIRERET